VISTPIALPFDRSRFDRRQADHLLRQLAHIAAELRSVGMSSREISSALRRLAQGPRP
jgi:hypothetical protein